MENLSNYPYLLFAAFVFLIGAFNLSNASDDSDKNNGNDQGSKIERIAATINGESYLTIESKDALIKLDHMEAELTLNGDIFGL